MELPEKLAQPAALGDDTVLRFSTGTRDGGVMFGRPRHQIVAKVDTVARHGAAGVGAPRLTDI